MLTNVHVITENVTSQARKGREVFTMLPLGTLPHHSLVLHYRSVQDPHRWTYSQALIARRVHGVHRHVLAHWSASV